MAKIILRGFYREKPKKDKDDPEEPDTTFYLDRKAYSYNAKQFETENLVIDPSQTKVLGPWWKPVDLVGVFAIDGPKNLEPLFYITEVQVRELRKYQLNTEIRVL